MFELRPLDSLDFVEMQQMVDNLNNSQSKLGSGAKVAVLAAGIAIGGVAYVATRPRVKRALAELFSKAETTAESV